MGKNYRKEVMKIRIDKTYIGLWQLHTLASVPDTPIYSIYPKLGNPNVRTDRNRLKSVNRKTVKTVMTLTWYRHF
jgi:hypothetical protein